MCCFLNCLISCEIKGRETTLVILVVIHCQHCSIFYNRDKILIIPSLSSSFLIPQTLYYEFDAVWCSTQILCYHIFSLWHFTIGCILVLFRCIIWYSQDNNNTRINLPDTIAAYRLLLRITMSSYISRYSSGTYNEVYFCAIHP